MQVSEDSAKLPSTDVGVLQQSRTNGIKHYCWSDRSGYQHGNLNRLCPERRKTSSQARASSRKCGLKGLMSWGGGKGWLRQV
jgi:hypothetical protein